MDSARLRRSFRYPSEELDDEEHDAGEALDEEGQEKVIQRLKDNHDAQRIFYTKALLLVSLLPSPLYLTLLLSHPLLAVLGITSLLSTAYAAVALPASPASLKLTAGLASGFPFGRGFGIGKTDGQAPARSVFGSPFFVSPSRPVERYLNLLNGTLSGLLFLMTFIRASGRWGEMANWLGLVPACVFALVLLSRREMDAVDIEGLESLRYEFKGA